MELATTQPTTRRRATRVRFRGDHPSGNEDVLDAGRLGLVRGRVRGRVRASARAWATGNL